MNFVKQTRHHRKTIGQLLLVLIAILLITWGISCFYALPMNWLMTDPPALFKTNQFIGFTTFIGVIVLSMGMGSVTLLMITRSRSLGKEEFQVMFGLALITLFLVLDDLLMFHERIFTGWLHVGERTIFIIYLLLFLTFLFVNRTQIFNETAILFIISGLFFVISLSADVLSDKFYLPQSIAATVDIIEEGGKLGGYLFWTAFLIHKSKALLQPEVDSESSSS
jgi:hypothetical protein